MSDTEEQVLVKVLECEASSTCTENESTDEPAHDNDNVDPVDSTSEVLGKLLSGNLASPCVAGPSTFILYIPGFRKIEPKPELEAKEVAEESESSEREGNASCVTPATRLLDINATKRGVKTCPQCSNKIGYRAKQCKHCSPNKRQQKTRRRASATIKTATETPEEIRVENKRVGAEDEITVSESVPEAVAVSEAEAVAVSAAEAVSVSATEAVAVNAAETVFVNVQEGVSVSAAEAVAVNAAEAVAVSAAEAVFVNVHEGVSVSAAEAVAVSAAEAVFVSVHEAVSASTAEAVAVNAPEEEENVQTDTTVDMSKMMVSNETEVEVELDEEKNDGIEVIAETVVEESVAQISIPEQTAPFVPGKDHTTEAPHPITEKFTLQDLICGLLAQNHAPLPSTTCAEPSTETTTIAIQTEPQKQSTVESQGNLESDAGREEQSLDKKGTDLSENAVDANSVALFLGQMAQRNGKKRQIPPSYGAKSMGLDTQGSGISYREVAFSGVEGKPSKFRKIQPKNSTGVIMEEVVVCDGSKDEIGDVKSEAGQCRLMNGTATRRGVMECSKCHRMIGCRSKTCKHCKKQVTEEPPRRRKGWVHVTCSAVQLHLPEELNIKLFSVRKCKTGPELRCFVKMKGSADNAKLPGKTTSGQVYLCDYPLCLTAKEIGNKSFICDHAQACFHPSALGKAEIPRLDLQKLLDMPINDKMKDSVIQLNEECIAKGVPLVQYVSSKTLAIVDQLQPDQNSLDSISFAHVRFDNVKNPGCFQSQVFCSGKACMAWNFISSEGSPYELMRLCSCTHYAASLWAIASDNCLAKDFGEYLDVFMSQAKAKGDTHENI